MKELLTRTITGVCIVLAIVGAVLAGRFYLAALLLLIAVFSCIELAHLCNKPWKFFLAALYVVVGLSGVFLLYWISDYDAAIVLGLFVLIWSSDIFAYVTGSLFGKHKLWPKVSPSKTWEGAAGGFLFALGIGYVWHMAYIPQVSDLKWIVVSVLTVIGGMAGDLLESKIKRLAGRKDSGRFLPGHGGVLDRFDSIYLAAPVAFICWWLI